MLKSLRTLDSRYPYIILKKKKRIVNEATIYIRPILQNPNSNQIHQSHEKPCYLATHSGLIKKKPCCLSPRL